jgi:hypothetical protein
MHTVYSNSVLATLNARQAIRELGEDSEDLSFSLQPTFVKSESRGCNSTVWAPSAIIRCTPWHFNDSVQQIYPLRLTRPNNTYRIPLDQSPMYVLHLVRFILSQVTDLVPRSRQPLKIHARNLAGDWLRSILCTSPSAISILLNYVDISKVVAITQYTTFKHHFKFRQWSDNDCVSSVQIWTIWTCILDSSDPRPLIWLAIIVLPSRPQIVQGRLWTPFL